MSASEILVEADTARDSFNWAEAARGYREFLDIEPNAMGIWVQLGNMLKELGRFDDARSAYFRALSLQTKEPDTYAQMGHVEKLDGNLDFSLNWYRRALDIDPDFAAAQEEVDRLDAPSALGPQSDAGPAASAGELSAMQTQLDRLERSVERLDSRGGDHEDSVLRALTRSVAELRRTTTASEQALLDVKDVAKQNDIACSQRQSDLEARIERLEAQSPTTARQFSALLEYFEHLNQAGRNAS
ncbi:MAG: hypothetical protein ACFB2Z_04100 [Maricaulaceae bacterium]